MRVRTAVAGLCLVLGLGVAVEAAAQKGKAPKGPDTKAIAAQIVKQVANVKPGEIVALRGDPRDIDILDDLIIEVQKQGAHAFPVILSERLGRRWFDEVPQQYDAQRPALALKLWQLPSVDIWVGGEDAPGQLKHVPAARLLAANKAWEPVQKLLLKRNIRRVFVTNGMYPTAALAKQFAMTKDQLAKIFWDAVGVDLPRMQATAEAVRAVLAQGRQAHLTNPNGTDLRVGIQGRQVIVNDGVITDAKVKKGGAAVWVALPAGEVYLTPVPGTAEGKIVVDRLLFEGGEIRGLTVTFKAGKATSMTAKPGREFDRLKALYDAAGPRKDELGGIDVGVNQALRIPKGSKLLAWPAVGMITTGLGWNLDFGGDNAVGFGSYWHLPGSTLTVDGKPLVEKGELKVPVASSAAK